MALGAVATVALVVFGLVLSSAPGYGPGAWVFVLFAFGLVWWDVAYHMRLVHSRRPRDSARLGGNR